MPARILIPATTDAVTVPIFYQVRADKVPATLIATGLATTEEVDVLVTTDDGATNQTVLQEGSAVVLTATDTVKSINSPMTIGVLKDATAGAASVSITFGKRV